MRRRRALLFAVAGIVLLAVAALLPWPRWQPLEVAVRNETGARLTGLTLSDEGLETPLPALENGQVITVKPRLGGGEGTLSLLDSEGREYLVLGYFEGDPGGDATIVLTASTLDGLHGTVDDETHYHALGKHDLERLER